VQEAAGTVAGAPAGLPSIQNVASRHERGRGCIMTETSYAATSGACVRACVSECGPFRHLEVKGVAMLRVALLPRRKRRVLRLPSQVATRAMTEGSMLLISK